MTHTLGKIRIAILGLLGRIVTDFGTLARYLM